MLNEWELKLNSVFPSETTKNSIDGKKAVGTYR